MTWKRSDPLKNTQSENLTFDPLWKLSCLELDERWTPLDNTLQIVLTVNAAYGSFL